jgi:replicative DNA helicase Mcm
MDEHGWSCECVRCREVQYRKQGYGTIVEPWYCPVCDTKTTPWNLVRKASEYEDHMALVLQNPPESMGNSKEQVEVVLLDDLARAGIEGGEVVSITGEFKAIHEKSATVAKKVIEASSVQVADDTLDQQDIDRHREAIEEIASLPDPMDALVESIAPDHMGDPHIKEGLVLQLLRGNDVEAMRDTVHMFLLGDPGAGKTDFGDALVDLAPRAEKTSGNGGTSAAGLTAAIVRDDFGGSQFTVQAGALPNCSGGALFVDELDSATEADQDAMLEAMESGVINIQKAGEKATLEADTAVLAAGNPTNGHFDKDKPPAEQTRVPSPLLDRFDLIFFQ